MAKIVLSNGATLTNAKQLDAVLAQRPARVVQVIAREPLAGALSDSLQEWEQLSAGDVDREGLAEAGRLILGDLQAMITRRKA